MDATKALKIGLVQNDPRPGAGIANLEGARPLIDAAASAGARLIALPELSATGYRPSLGMWRYGEAAGGPTEQWLRDAARELGVYLCAGYLETDGEDFFNTYAVAGPGGDILGRVRKESPSMGENYLFRGASGTHVVDTPIGRIGVGICNDNHMAFLPGRFREQRPDLILMPHAWPLPSASSRLVSEADIQRQRTNMVELPARYARGLGVHVAFTNLAGSLDMGGERSPGFLGALLPPPEDYVFPGYAAVHAAGGEILRSREGGEGWISVEIRLGDNSGTRSPHEASPMPTYGRRVYPGNADSAVLRFYESHGRSSYRKSMERKRLARDTFQDSARSVPVRRG